MTDKQIIIDGVDVSGCEHRCDTHKTLLADGHIMEFANYCQITNDGCYAINCYYKQLKRKEQECERLKNKLTNWLGKEGLRQSEKEFYEEQLDRLKRSEAQCEAMFVSHTDLEKKYKAKEQECEELKEQLDSISREAEDFDDEAQEIFTEKTNLEIEVNELKAENETLKQYKASKQASYESMQREWNNAVNENRELKQTLAEIKPILELYANSKIGEEQPDGTYKIVEEAIGAMGGACIVHYDPRPAREGLRKISECEAEDGV